MPLSCHRFQMERFVEALESGDYKQGKHTLRTDADEYCCLGVACEISGRGRWMKPEGDGQPWSYVTDAGYASGTMPKPVIDWLGLERTDGEVSTDLDALPLSPYEETGWSGERETAYNYGTSCNDSGETFAQIAQRIRETYLTDAPAETIPA